MYPAIKLCEPDVFRRFQMGDEAAFRQIFDLYQPPLYRRVCLFCQDDAEAEEVAQEAFVQLFLKRQTIDRPEGIYPFLHTVAKRMAISLFRKHVLKAEYQNDLRTIWQEDHLQTQQEIAYRDLRELWLDTVRQLPPRQQLLYRMNKLEDHSYEEIAEKMGLSKNTVRNHLSLATKFVRLRLGKILFS